MIHAIYTRTGREIYQDRTGTEKMRNQGSPGPRKLGPTRTGTNNLSKNRTRTVLVGPDTHRPARNETNNFPKSRPISWSVNPWHKQELIGLAIDVLSGPWIPDESVGQILSLPFLNSSWIVKLKSELKWTSLRDSIWNWFGQLIRLPVTSKEKVKAWRHFTRREKSLWRHRHFFPNIYLRKKPREKTDRRL